uniref:Orf (-)1 n=1 Tax=Streptoalloteichus hindustanus TaxID=2017 RepID=A4KUD7_STRHI|nr:Orf (-)1 [Streptoalloteichus hindustanus]
MTTTGNRTSIEADPVLPTIRVVREFDAPPARVYRAWTDPALVVRWMGANDLTLRLDTWDARTGGSYRYAAPRDGAEVAAFYGSFHELRPNERLVQTMTYEGLPDGVCLETITFEDLGDGRTRTTSVTVVDTMEARDGLLVSTEHGVVEGFARMDSLLAEG